MNGARMVIQNRKAFKPTYWVGVVNENGKALWGKTIYRQVSVPMLSKLAASYRQKCAQLGYQLEEGWHKY